METQTTETPQEIADRLAAVERYKEEHQKWLDRHAGTSADPEKVRDFETNVEPWAKKAFTEKPVPPAPGPSWRERMQERTDKAALMGELARVPEKSPEAKVIVQDIIDMHAEQTAKRPPAPDPMVYTRQDYERSPSAQGFSQTEKTEVWLRVQRAGGDAAVATQLIADVRTFRDRIKNPAYQDFVAYAEEEIAAAQRSFAVLGYDGDRFEDLVADGLLTRAGEHMIRRAVAYDASRAATG